MAIDVGVIGLGVIGKPIAERLLKSGFRVCVYDVRNEPVAELQALGAKPCASPADVARHCEIIVSLVADAAQTDDVVLSAGGVLNALRPGSLFIIGSTLGPAPVRRLSQVLSANHCETLDAPISGGYLAAREGTLSVMTGGAQSTLERARPVLRAFARVITHAGDVGAGQAAKLAHQLVCSVNVMTLLEGLSLGVAGGVEPAVLKQIFREGIAGSSVLNLWDDLAPRWKGMLTVPANGRPPSNLQKDLHLVLDLARELGVGLHVCPAASLAADSGIATGRDDPRL